MNIEAALAHCPRDANGLLKLGGLWLEATASKRKHEEQAASKKRTREEAEEERVIAEIDAKRDLAAAELGAKVAKLEFARDREKLMLRLASEGNNEALKLLFPSRP
jgi:hypothetical protein